METGKAIAGCSGVVRCEGNDVLVARLSLLSVVDLWLMNSRRFTRRRGDESAPFLRRNHREKESRDTRDMYEFEAYQNGIVTGYRHRRVCLRPATSPPLNMSRIDAFSQLGNHRSES